MTTWVPLFSAVCSGFRERPPYSNVTRSLFEEARASMTPATWMASSRVGTSTRAWMRWTFGSHRSVRGTANARVLPDPVRAWPIRSRPAMRWGMAFC